MPARPRCWRGCRTTGAYRPDGARSSACARGMLTRRCGTALAAAPDRALEMADLYLQWGLARDALELLGHKGPNGAPAPDDALFLYYRSYCRDASGLPVLRGGRSSAGGDAGA